METDHIRRRLTALVEEHAVPGTQLAVHHGGNTWACELGEEVHGTGRRMTAGSQVPIGSVSKTCTAILAMILVTGDDVELDAPVTAYLPELRQLGGSWSGATQAGDGAGVDRLTLRHLLSHTGGLACDPPEGAGAPTLRRYAMDACRRLPALQPPGSGFSYSNIGYLLAGLVIEEVTGMTWWEAMDAMLFSPLGVAARFVAAPAGAPRPARGAASGHAVNPARGQVRPVEQSLASTDAPAGAVAASALDLVTIGRLLCGAGPGGPPGLPELVGPAELRAMQTPVPGAEPFGMADGWGLGLALYRHGDTSWWGHDGTADGTACHLRFEPASGTVVALTANASTGFALWRRLVPELAAAGLPVGSHDDRPGLRRTARAPRDCAGRYLNGETEYRVLTTGSGRLRLTVDGDLFGDLVPFDDLQFCVRDGETGEEQTGRFLTVTDTDRIRWIQVGGRLGRRQDRVREVA
jgi:CubicO group peptidase (beta-lactamase class C family)